MKVTAAPLRPTAGSEEDKDASRTAELRAAVGQEILDLLGWSDEVGMLFFPYDHHLLGMPKCRVTGCSQASVARQLCEGCRLRWRQAGRPDVDEYVEHARPGTRRTGVEDCSVKGCPRPFQSWRKPVCSTHLGQLTRLQVTLEEFLVRDDVVPLPAFGHCEVLACHRKRDGRSPYCHGHRVRWSSAVKRGLSTHDEARWRRTTAPVSANNEVSLRGLADRVVAEILYGIQARTREGLHTTQPVLRTLTNRLRELELPSLTAVDLDQVSRGERGFCSSLVTQVGRFGLTPEGERAKDVWNGAVFGHAGYLRFTGIHQPWLRSAAKEWAFFSLPQRRGKAIATCQEVVSAFALLSESLQLQREDCGNDIQAVGRRDITAFTNRLSYLRHTGVISARRTVVISRYVRSNLARMRSLGLTRSGEPLHGLPDDFALLAEDIPDDPEDTEAGKDLPPEVMRQVCEHLPSLAGTKRNGNENRVATELLIDTGRRPTEICQLRWDCLEQDSTGQNVLIYDNYKSGRKGRRLPISQATAGVITRQQELIRTDFPLTPTAELMLLPTRVGNPHGRKAIGAGWLSGRHREWIQSLPEFLVPTRVEINGQQVTKMLPFEKPKIFLYAYRHTYCQRHADQGIQPDVLQSLMDHRQLATTQRYYRVGEQRKREAVDRVSTMQFDRHGNRTWRQAKELLDDEYARRAVGEVQAPYGVCVEPSNVAAGGHACAVRFRCIGCDDFRTDASYLPDLEAYLADLLRNRERLAAFTSADDWAKAEATPSDEEITRVRRLVRRVREDLDALTDEDRAQIKEATSVLRRSRRHIVGLGMPRVGPPMPDFHPGRTA
ncbi:tyrosine-type recombinase/integrase [Streptomyces coeruleorubidus]|uniref:tyrosine-type recombinase/integrase n=1 Tax=Streptomyces coeruleorubidus TaxID=116188 RepID=UPI0019BF7BDD|nr:site-specific integrase [Streptomyces coeruleorubidus]GGU05847.1 transposase [Streptomyces coeruleorubidus]